MGYSKAINTKEPIDGLEVAYDNTSSGLTATNMQDAIDELNTEKAPASHNHSASEMIGLEDVLASKAPMYTSGTSDIGSGSALSTGTLYFMHES